MVKILKGRKALLLAEGCKIRKEMKVLDDRLKEIKEDMKLKEAGTYTNEAGDELVITSTQKFTEISPGNVLNYLKKKKMASRFPEIVKVQIVPLRKVAPETMIDKWRTPLELIFRWSWK